MNLNNHFILSIFLLIFGICLIFIGIFLIGYFPDKLKEIISKKVVIKENSEAFETWKKPPASVYIDFYFFNVTNYENFIKYNEKPILEEIGPYSYREVRDKKDIVFSKNNSVLSYSEYKSYFFDVERSNGRNDNDSFYSINIPILTLTTWAKNYNLIIQDAIKFLLDKAKENLFQKHTVNELLWGYELKITEDINNLLAKFDLHFNFPKFALYSGMSANGSCSGKYSISTGLDDIYSLARIKTWNDEKRLHFWTAPSCNQINGTDGIMFSPFINESSVLYMFNADICRSVHAVYHSNNFISSSNIPTYSFVPPDSVLQDHKHNPDNACFCTPNIDFCLGAGVINVSSCRDGAPLVISQPHFYQADEIYLNSIIGMKPDAAKHQTILNVEPNTGYVLQASKKVQINIFLQNLNSFRDTSNLNRSYVFPIFWGCEHATIDEDKAAQLKQELILPMRLVNITQYILVSIGCLIIALLAVAKLADVVKKSVNSIEVNEDDEPLISPN